MVFFTSRMLGELLGWNNRKCLVSPLRRNRGKGNKKDIITRIGIRICGIRNNNTIPTMAYIFMVVEKFNMDSTS